MNVTTEENGILSKDQVKEANAVLHDLVDGG